MAGDASRGPASSSCSPPRCSTSGSASATRATCPRSRRRAGAYDLLGDGFGEGSNGPLFLSNDPAADAASVAAVDALLAADPGIAFANPGFELAPGTWFWQAYPTTSPQDAETVELVEHLRDDMLPTPSIDVFMGGATAGSIDFADYLAARLPILIGGVLILSFLLLMVGVPQRARAAQGRRS